MVIMEDIILEKGVQHVGASGHAQCEATSSIINVYRMGYWSTLRDVECMRGSDKTRRRYSSF
jgi:hypothetical protein